MKILLVLLVSVLLISGKFAFRLDLLNNVSENSNEVRKNVKLSDNSLEEMQFDENIKSEEFKVEPNKRSKKSYYSEPPCNLCGYNGNQFAPRPAQGYGHSQFQPNTGGNYINSKPYASSPIYNGPLRPYQYSPNQFYPAPGYSQPAYNSYNKYPVPAYQGHSNHYPQPSHTSSSNLLVGCHPHVTTIPIGGYFPHYANSPYSPPPQHFQAAYRSNSKEDSSVSSSKNSDYRNEMTPEENTFFDNSSLPQVPNVSTETGVNNENNEVNQSVKKMEKLKTKISTLFDMTQQGSKNPSATEEKQKQSATKTDQAKKT